MCRAVPLDAATKARVPPDARFLLARRVMRRRAGQLTGSGPARERLSRMLRHSGNRSVTIKEGSPAPLAIPRGGHHNPLEVAHRRSDS